MNCLFYRVPPEVRDQIFRPFCLEWTGKMPNLVKALRPYKKLYHEALDLFVKNNVFVLHHGNKWTFGDMTKSAVLRFTKIKIIVDADSILKTGLFSVNALTTHDGSLWPESTALISDAINIREVTLQIKSWTDNEPLYVSHGPIRYHFNYFLKPFNVLDRVEVHFPWNLRSTMTIHDQWDLTPALASANTHLKKMGKLISVIAMSANEESWFGVFDPFVDVGPTVKQELWERWFWEAEEGMHLRGASNTAGSDVVESPARSAKLALR